MARGKLKRSKDKRSKKFNNRKNYQGKKRKVESFRKRDSSHQKDSKETHHIEDSERVHKRRKVLSNEPKKNSHNVDNDYSSEGEEDIFKQLVTEFSSGYFRNQRKAMESDTSSEDDSEVGRNENIIPDDDEEEEKTAAAESDDSSSDGEEEEESMGSDQEEIDDQLDPFVCHFHYDLEETMLETLYKLPHSAEKTQQHWPVIGQFILHLPKVENVHSPKPVSKFSLENEKQFANPGKLPQRITSINWTKMHIKPQIQHNISKANIKNLSTSEHTSVSSLTPCQLELFSLINNYQDLYYPERNLRNREEIRFVYCLHSINHILKTRTKILHHNQKLIDKDDVPEEYRDQGLVRPKVLILVPFRESALRVLKMMMEILVPDEKKADIMHKKRFFDEFTGNEIAMPRKKPKPEDYEATFSGNTDDNFRIGISITKKSLRLYADFYSADIIVASPLGLRVIIGAEGEMERDYDFLASIEVLVLDEADIFFMQNWDHLLHVLDHIHLQPKEAHGTNFARVRSWALNGWTCYYRQTLLFSSVMLPEFNSLMNKKCHNYAGKICIMNPVTTGSICQLVVQVPQVFQRFEAQSVAESLDTRFDYFVKKILSEFKSTVMNHVLIYVPSYFDYVRLRNHFKREDLNFVQICEYSKDGKVARARDMFFHAEAHFLLYSERFHFFRRPTIKGIQHILFYQPPTFPNFYSEICNFMHEINQPKQGGNESNMTITVLYSKYDIQQLAAIVGTDRAARMVNSERNVHMFMTGE